MPDIGEKVDIDMNRRKIIYIEAPQTVSRAIIEGDIIVDFLPSAKELVRKDTKVKIPKTQKEEVLCDVF